MQSCKVVRKWGQEKKTYLEGEKNLRINSLQNEGLILVMDSDGFHFH